jgi:hypothetical protein
VKRQPRETTQTLLEALGIQPGSGEDNERRRALQADLDRIREAERAALVAMMLISPLLRS